MKENKVFKIIKLIKNIICWTLIAVLVFTLVVFFMSRINGSTPSVFGYSIFRVSSGSMEPELMVGDIILDKTVDNPEDLKVGDVITFKSSDYGDLLVTHKVIKAPYEENGKLMLQTKGIANEVEDKPISVDNVKGIMICKVDYLDTVYNVFLSPWGLLILIALIVIIFFDEIITIVKILTNNDRSVKDADDINEIIDRLQAEKLKEQAEKVKEQSEKTEEKSKNVSEDSSEKDE
ncbi:signal peptidase I [Ruminococcus sp.]|uniref:signal peptidase I n=1 Tax=Ruminococcus sp. TaxID=41978 RepID=UPI0025DD23DF|nr:signal peptidase I [Ruminococcus sp.]MCI6616310.1 signal peptidase I [Ruminococcus sp.]